MSSTVYIKTISCILRTADYIEFCKLAEKEGKTPNDLAEDLIRAYIEAAADMRKSESKY